MKMKKSLPILISSVFILFLITSNIFAQIDPTAYDSKTAMPTRLIMPQVYHAENYGIENINTVMQYGAFDNYMVSFSNGFAETHIVVN